MNKWVYTFGEVAEAEKYTGSWDGVRSLLGGKGANLGEMTRIDVPVPPGFTVALKLVTLILMQARTSRKVCGNKNLPQ